MKSLFRAILALALMLSVIMAVGCSKKENPTAPATQAQNQLPAAQQGAVAQIGESMALAAEGNVDYVSGLMDGTPKDGKTPPAGWHGPDANGWYWWYYGGDSTSYYYKYEVRLTPDVWGSGTPPVTKVEWRMTYRDTTTNNYWYYARCEYQSTTDTTHVKGVWEYHFNYSYGGYNLGYNWVMNYDNVSISPSDHSGHYSFTCSYPTYGTTGVIQVNLTGEFTFNANGSGTGKMYAGGTEVVRYVFYAAGSNPRGYYTLASENWATQHNFGK